ncbi:MAG: hypothetical protein AAGA54_08085 [Myxococcota bacterium]
MAEVTIILPVRDQENDVASLVRGAVRVEEYVDTRGESLSFELLALDERSGDNTLSVLSVLHGQIANLRTLQDVEPGAAIRRAAKVARGEVWLILDHAIDPELAGWAVTQVFRGQRAAFVPGELLAVERDLGSLLLRHHGGLVSAQNRIAKHLKGRRESAAFSPAPDGSTKARAKRLLRGGLGKLGLGRFDRP